MRSIIVFYLIILFCVTTIKAQSNTIPSCIDTIKLKERGGLLSEFTYKGQRWFSISTKPIIFEVSSINKETVFYNERCQKVCTRITDMVGKTLMVYPDSIKEEEIKYYRAMVKPLEDSKTLPISILRLAQQQNTGYIRQEVTQNGITYRFTRRGQFPYVIYFSDHCYNSLGDINASNSSGDTSWWKLVGGKYVQQYTLSQIK